MGIFCCRQRQSPLDLSNPITTNIALKKICDDIKTVASRTLQGAAIGLLVAGCLNATGNAVIQAKNYFHHTDGRSALSLRGSLPQLTRPESFVTPITILGMIVIGGMRGLIAGIDQIKKPKHMHID